jgi:hypothetical protein
MSKAELLVWTLLILFGEVVKWYGAAKIIKVIGIKV